MASSSQQTKRNDEIAAARAAGESVAALSLQFSLSRSRIKQIIKEWSNQAAPATAAVEAAQARRSEYRAVVAELGDLARRLPDSQPAPKVGAYRVLLDALDRLTSIERALGFLPDDLGRLRSERALVEAVFASSSSTGSPPRHVRP